MKERIEAWRAREKLHADIGGVSVLVGIFGAVGIWAGILEATRPDERQPSLSWPVVLLLGVGLLACAVGLWNGKPWARWACVAYFALWFVSDVIGLVREHVISLGLLVFPLLVVYLLSPSTAKLFERARSQREGEGAT